MRWLIFILCICIFLPGLARGTRPKLRLACWNLAGLYDEVDDPWDDPLLEPWLVEARLECAARVLRPLHADLLGLLELEKRPLAERLARECGCSTVVALEGPHGLALLSRTRVLGYRSFAAGPQRVLEVHLGDPWSLVVLVAQVPEPRASWRVATRVWELAPRLVAVLGELGPTEQPWLREVGLRQPVPGVYLAPGLARKVLPKSLKTDQRKLAEKVSPYPPARLDVR